MVINHMQILSFQVLFWWLGTNSSENFSNLSPNSSINTESFERLLRPNLESSWANRIAIFCINLRFAQFKSPWMTFYCQVTFSTCQNSPVLKIPHVYAKLFFDWSLLDNNQSYYHFVLFFSLLYLIRIHPLSLFRRETAQVTLAL